MQNLENIKSEERFDIARANTLMRRNCLPALLKNFTEKDATAATAPQFHGVLQAEKDVLRVLREEFVEYVDDQVLEQLLLIFEGNYHLALSYLYTTNLKLGGVRPIDLLKESEAGREKVMEHLSQKQLVESL